MYVILNVFSKIISSTNLLAFLDMVRIMLFLVIYDYALEVVIYVKMTTY
jgi:hypothetical protein